MIYSLLTLLVGLRYEDIMISEYPATKEALDLSHPDVMKGRMRRLKRASDLTYKAKNLQDYAPDMKMEPFKMEIRETIERIKARDEERALLELHKK